MNHSGIRNICAFAWKRSWRKTRTASFNVTNLVILKPARIHSSSGIWFHILQACTQMYQIGMTSAGRSAPVGRETRGTAGRRGRETLPHQGVTNRYPVHSMLPNSSATGNAILFLGANVFGRVPQGMGRFRPPSLGKPKHMRCFAYIYKAILHAENSGHSGYFAKNDLLHDSGDSGYFARKTVMVLYPRYPGSLRPTFSAFNFNSSNFAELKILPCCLPHTCVVGCGELVVGFSPNPPLIYERISDCFSCLSVVCGECGGFCGKSPIREKRKKETYRKISKTVKTHHNPPQPHTSQSLNLE